MQLELPKPLFNDKNSISIPALNLPYPLDIYGVNKDAGGIRTLKEISEEAVDLLRRFVVLLPEVVMCKENEKHISYFCMVNDESSGISRGVLEHLGYVLVESDYSPHGLYWIELRTRGEKGRSR